ncbi:hypothetical protein [Blautia sp.]|uniref:hypothetical protein n=1 Tax=Blautia sp. TaxID=1955243 RepID=UPI003AAFFC15
MKIGSMTFNESINYGSVLQAWALQKVLLDSGYTVEVIDYEPEAYHKLYDIFVFPFSPLNIKVNLNP